MVPVVGERRAILLALLFCLFLLVSMSAITFASSNNWVEVVRFEGSEDIQTEPFTCNYIEWRIKWNSSPDYQHRGGGKTLFGIFSVRVFEHITEKFVTSFGNGVSNESDNGTFSFNENGTFYLEIDAFNINEYSIIIEQTGT